MLNCTNFITPESLFHFRMLTQQNIIKCVKDCMLVFVFKFFSNDLQDFVVFMTGISG